MDGARRRDQVAQFEKWHPSFNPCFDGWGSPTSLLIRMQKRLRRVSILVLMDGARRPFAILISRERN